jgi:hypothetical protein
LCPGCTVDFTSTQIKHRERARALTPWAHQHHKCRGSSCCGCWVSGALVSAAAGSSDQRLPKFCIEHAVAAAPTMPLVLLIWSWISIVLQQHPACSTYRRFTCLNSGTIAFASPFLCCPCMHSL